MSHWRPRVVCQAKLRELERKYELQAVKHEELTLEMDQLRRQADTAARVLPTVQAAMTDQAANGNTNLSDNANANNLAAGRGLNMGYLTVGAIIFWRLFWYFR